MHLPVLSLILENGLVPHDPGAGLAHAVHEERAVRDDGALRRCLVLLRKGAAADDYVGRVTAYERGVLADAHCQC
jgi:hypothetical protein